MSKKRASHIFHIPVMGIGFTVDTPIKVAHFGISSSISIMQDELLELMREHYCKKTGRPFQPITKSEEDYRAKRITAYLNLIRKIVHEKFFKIHEESFKKGKDIRRYFELLPENSEVKCLYKKMLDTKGIMKVFYQKQLRSAMNKGSIDVNIMTKVDRPNYSKGNEPLPKEYSDAMAALRGFAQSELSSSIIFSAGLNPRLYTYLEEFDDFFPNHKGYLKKKVILKVSDYRSALIQGKFLANKGVWVSEFRVESGLNCGGHAFPTTGNLLGPVLEEFKINRKQLLNELFNICNDVLERKGKNLFRTVPDMMITVQGGIGTHAEDKFLREYYGIDKTGWGSPFLLVPEATNVDEATLTALTNAQPRDYFLSKASPLGVPFNNFKKSSSEQQRLKRIEKNKPGSPCYRKHLASNTEFTKKPICTASRKYQKLKIKELEKSDLSEVVKNNKINEVLSKDCLCEGLSTVSLLKNNLPTQYKQKAVTICPGPNLRYFSSVFSLKEMVGHIYGRNSILNTVNRSHMFMNELKMYVDYLKNEIEKEVNLSDIRRLKYLQTFQTNLLNGIKYYTRLLPQFNEESAEWKKKMRSEMEEIKKSVNEFYSLKKKLHIIQIF